MDSVPPHAHDGNTPTKVCSKCKREWPATTEYFSVQKAYRGRKERLNSHCKDCKHKKDAVYTALHSEERKLYKAGRKEEDKLYMQRWRKENQEQVKEYDEKYRREHAQHMSERHKAYCGVYYKTERGLVQMRVSSQNRRARKRNAVGTHTTDELYAQLQRQKNTCYYCKRTLEASRRSWHAEHVEPLSRGGSNSIDNIVIACRECNLSKGHKLPHEWERGTLL